MALAGLFAAVTALAAGASGCGHVSALGAPSPRARKALPPTSTTVSDAGAPPASAGVLGLVLSGGGTHLKAPTGPTDKPYSPNCQDLMDPAFHGTCVTASGRQGSIAGVVEEEQAAFTTQERDLVWKRVGRHWALALVHVVDMCRNGLECGASPGLPTLLWSDDITRERNPELVFVTPTDRPGFGNELDVVNEAGQVSLFRYLGEGFALVPPSGGLVTYVPGSTEARPADSYFDQTLIGFAGGHWRVLSQQFVPYSAALAQHKGAFWDPNAVPAFS